MFPSQGKSSGVRESKCGAAAHGKPIAAGAFRWQNANPQ
jgi:hypothetical protein